MVITGLNFELTKNSTKPFLNHWCWILLLTIILAYLSSIYFGKINLNSISEGDFGRDLYSFYLASKGQIPEINFNWIYGPLTPFLYGLTFKLFGVSILNAVSQWFITFIAVVYLIYFLISSIINRFSGFLAGIMFIVYHSYFIHTFNHIYGTLFIIISLIFIYYFFDSQKPQFLYFLAISCYFLTLDKLNMGIAFGFTIFLILIIYHYIKKENIQKPLLAFGGYIILSLLTYGFLLANTPADQIIKCFPYGSKYLTHSSGSFLRLLLGTDVSTFPLQLSKNNILLVLHQIFTDNLWYLLILLFAAAIAYQLYRKNKPESEIAFVLSLIALSVACSNEFLLIGTTYSLRFWVLPIVIVLIFYTAKKTLEISSSRKFSTMFFIFILLIFLFGIASKLFITASYKNIASHYCPYKRVKVSITNQDWFYIMISSIEYIKNNTGQEEKVLTLPQNLLYNFIAERDFPSRINEFAQLSNVTEEEQLQVINDIENTKTRLILLSNKTNLLSDYGLGVFGKTHCSTLYNYINDNYYVDTTIYLAKNNPLAAPIILLKRKTPFQEKKP